MIYRVIMEVGGKKAFFDFDEPRIAGALAETLIRHQTANEDTPAKKSVTIEVIKEDI